MRSRISLQHKLAASLLITCILLGQAPLAAAEFAWSEPYLLPTGSQTSGSNRMKYWLGYDDAQVMCSPQVIEEFAQQIQITLHYLKDERQSYSIRLGLDSPDNFKPFNACEVDKYKKFSDLQYDPLTQSGISMDILKQNGQIIGMNFKKDSATGFGSTEPIGL